MQVIRAYRVNDIVMVTSSRLPRNAGDVFPELRMSLLQMELEGGRVELLMRLDNRL